MNQTIDLLKNINNELSQFKTSIEVLINQNNEYIDSMNRYLNKEFTIENEEGETLEQRKIKADSMLDQLEDINDRSKLEIQNINEFEQKTNQIKELIEGIKTSYSNDKMIYERKKSEIEIEVLNIIETMKQNDFKRINEQKIDINNQYKQMENQYLSDEIKTKLETIMLDFHEYHQLEQWTNKKFGEIVFDTNTDDWNQNTSNFHNKIINKKDLLFIVQSDNDIHFGTYIHSKIGNIGWCHKESGDDKSFTFSFKDDIPRKFSIKQNAKIVFHLNSSSDSLLFGIGSNDYNINKKNCKSSLAQQQQSNATFDYNSINHPFTGSSGGDCFTHKRVVVIQME